MLSVSLLRNMRRLRNQKRGLKTLPARHRWPELTGCHAEWRHCILFAGEIDRDPFHGAVFVHSRGVCSNYILANCDAHSVLIRHLDECFELTWTCALFLSTERRAT